MCGFENLVLAKLFQINAKIIIAIHESQLEKIAMFSIIFRCFISFGKNIKRRC